MAVTYRGRQGGVRWRWYRLRRWAMVWRSMRFGRGSKDIDLRL